jgi:hypothetical protein
MLALTKTKKTPVRNYNKNTYGENETTAISQIDWLPSVVASDIDETILDSLESRIDTSSYVAVDSRQSNSLMVAIQKQTFRKWVSGSSVTLCIASIFTICVLAIGILIHSAAISNVAAGYLAGHVISFVVGLQTWRNISSD